MNTRKGSKNRSYQQIAPVFIMMNNLSRGRG